MNLPKISISRSSFSSRFFIYFLFGLVILVLLIEGGYFLYLKKKVPTAVLSDEFGTVVNKGVFSSWTSPDKSQKFIAIAGQVKRIEDRTLFVADVEKPDNKNLVKVIVSEDASISIEEGEFSLDDPMEGLELLSPTRHTHGKKVIKGDINEILIGSVIIAGNVEETKDGFLTKDLIVARPK